MSVHIKSGVTKMNEKQKQKFYTFNAKMQYKSGYKTFGP